MVRMSVVVDSLRRPSAALVVRAQGGDERAQERVVRQMMPMAERVAKRFADRQHPVEDLTQVAGIGLLKAIERFDGTRDNSFATYAQALMTGEVRRNIRDSRMVRIPRQIYEQVPAFQRALSRLRTDLGREPSRDELAADLGVSKEDVIEIMAASISADHLSLDAAAEAAGGEFDLPHHDAAFAQVEAGAMLEPILSALTARERLIIDLRFGEGLSQSEIAGGMGVSQMQVSRLVRGALAKLSERAGV